jgi:hypothetical protein
VKKIYLHIGTEKTGTTTLQYFLKKNELMLNELGFSFYCETNKPYYEETYTSRGHFPLVAAIMNQCPDFVTEKKFSTRSIAFKQLKVDMQRKNKHAILSAEHFSSRLHSITEIKKLHDALNFGEIKIICYIRPQDELALSSYSTYIKSGGRSLFNVESINKHSPFYNYSIMLKPWVKIFGAKNILLKKFEKSKMRHQDICHDFLGTIGIDVYDKFLFPEPMNLSLDASQLELLRIMNLYLPAFGEKTEADYHEAQALRKNIAPLLAKGKPLSSLFNAADRDFLLKEFSQSNKEIEHLFV